MIMPEISEILDFESAPNFLVKVLTWI